MQDSVKSVYEYPKPLRGKFPPKDEIIAKVMAKYELLLGYLTGEQLYRSDPGFTYFHLTVHSFNYLFSFNVRRPQFIPRQIMWNKISYH